MKNWIRVLETWQTGPCRSGLSFSVSAPYCLCSVSRLFSPHLSSPFFPLSFLLSFPPLPSPPSHLWKNMASLQFLSLHVLLSLHVTVPAISETPSHSQFQICRGKYLVDLRGSHSPVTRGAGFKSKHGCRRPTLCIRVGVTYQEKVCPLRSYYDL